MVVIPYQYKWIEEGLLEVEGKHRAHQQAHDHTCYTEDNHQIHDLLGSLVFGFMLQNEAQGDKDESIAQVCVTEAKEEHEEGCKEGREVKLVVIGQHIHLADGFEEAGKPVVTQLYGWRILRLGVL